MFAEVSYKFGMTKEEARHNRWRMARGLYSNAAFATRVSRHARSASPLASR